MAKLSTRKISAPSVPPELEGFGYRAVIDRIEIELTLTTPSQWHHVKKRASTVWGNVYVKSLGPIESSTKFRIRVQDPRPADEFMRQVRLVAQEGESLTEISVKITGVEISIDARHPSNDPELLARATLYLMKHQAHLPKGLPRITAPPYFDAPILAAKYAAVKAAHKVATADALREGKESPPRLPKKYGTCPVAESNRDALEALRRGLSINQGKAPVDETGKRGDNYRARDYVKTKDTQDNVPYAPLPPKKHSARTERTWQDDAVPFTTIEEWRNFRFETLSRYFELVKPIVPTTGLSALFQERMIQFGHSVDEADEALRPDGAIAKSREPGYRHSKRLGFCADTEVNADIKTALRCLTLRSRVKIRKESGDTKPLPSLGERGLDVVSPKYSNTNTNTARERKFKSATQSPLTSATPANNSCFLATHSNLIPRQVHRQFGQRANQCGPPKGPPNQRRPYPQSRTSQMRVALNDSFFQELVNVMTKEEEQAAFKAALAKIPGLPNLDFLIERMPSDEDFQKVLAESSAEIEAEFQAGLDFDIDESYRLTPGPHEAARPVPPPCLTKSTRISLRVPSLILSACRGQAKLKGGEISKSDKSHATGSHGRVG